MSQSLSLSKTRPGGKIEKRRNGLRPACENCRKAKVRCDIADLEPACSRCRNRKTPTACIVLEAPMTKSKPNIILPSPVTVSPTQSTQSPAPSISTPSLLGNTPGSTYSKSTQNWESPVYLGLTSYSSTLHHSEFEPPAVPHNGFTCNEDQEFDPRDVSLGVHVLKYIPDEKTANLFLDIYFENTVGFIGVPKSIVKKLLTSTFVAFGRSFEYPWNEQELKKTAQCIIRNGEGPLVEPDDPNDWASQDQIRWDIIGMFFIAFAYAILSSNHKKHALVDEAIAHRDHNVVIREIKKCIESCMTLARKSLCTRLVNLVYRHLILETVLEGDASLSVWRHLSDLVAVSTALGLHCYQGTPKVTLQSEMTKRISAVCFYSDKELAMFTGRPPALSHRYYTCPLPLDISDEVLIQGGEVLQREIDNLDENGWSKNRETHDGTFIRVRILSGLIQDEIMELFLGKPAYFSLERVHALKVRTIKTFEAVPHITNVSKKELTTASGDNLWRFLFRRLDSLRLHFLLERLLVERGGESKQKLLDVSREMVDLTVFLWLQRDRAISRHYDFDYVIMCYGMPSTGILCAALIKQIRHPNTSDVKLPCSEVVQNLSFMIGFLEWIQPEAGNYKLCQHMSKVIKRVLEHAFDPPLVEEVAEPGEEWDAAFWGMDGVDDFEWLNGIDWGRASFPEMANLG